MKHRKPELGRRTVLLILPLLVIVAVTVAWFINSPMAHFGEMSFASTPSGAGAAISVGAVDEAQRVFTAAPNESVANTVTWGETLPMEESTITVRNMVPGECAYYRFRCNRPAEISITSLVQLDEEGVPVLDRNVQLADYLSVYLYPLVETDGVIEAVPDVPLLEKTRITSALLRETEAPFETYLAGAIFLKNTWREALFTPLDGDTVKDYVMVVYCDTRSHETLPGHQNLLEGAVSFRMSFVAEAS